MVTTNLAGMLVGHMVGDYLAQNDWMAAGKLRSTPIAALHAAMWTAAVCCYGWCFHPGFILWLFVTHLLIDRFRLAALWMDAMGQRNFRNALAPWSTIAVDNAWHLVTIWIGWATVG